MKCCVVFVLFLFSLGISTCFAGLIQNLGSYLWGNLEENQTEPVSIHIGNLTHKHRSFIPFARPLYPYAGTTEPPDNKTDCGDDGEDEFPAFFTEEQQKKGAVILCFLIGTYCFTLLAVVCNKYFLPSIERLCEVLNISADVGAATFMSVATSCPELFTNIVAVFISGSELGIGTIVGSSMFNSLGVASIGSLAAAAPIQLDWWPVTRDVFIYMMSVSVLVVIVWDNTIYWYEGLTLFIIYFIYFFVMFQNPRISRFVRRIVDKWQSRNKVKGTTGDAKLDEEEKEKQINRDSVRVSVLSAYGSYSEQVRRPGYENTEAYKQGKKAEEEYVRIESAKSPFKVPEGGFWSKFEFFYTWPIKMLLRCTMPNPKLHPNLWPITFIMCIVWIGTNSYMVSWMITIIGTILGIPSTVQGMTFSAFGSALPESISIAIMSRRGEGKMGVSNTMGANTMNILFSLGMPWFFKTISMGTNNQSFITIRSGSIVYTITALLVVATFLYVVLFFNKFRLSRITGSFLVPMYLICIALACVSEMVFFPQKCGS